MSDDPSVMGNLPRSRPGRRSDKRAAPGGAAPGAGRAKASGSGGKAGTGRKASASTRKAPASRGKASTSPRTAAQPPRRPPARRPDPLGDAVRVATKVAGAGLGIAAEVLKRLPRP